MNPIRMLAAALVTGLAYAMPPRQLAKPKHQPAPMASHYGNNAFLNQKRGRRR